MTIGYLYSKFFKKIIRGKSIIHSNIDELAVVASGSNIVNTSMGRYSYCGYDCDFMNVEIGSYCSISDHVFIGGAEHPMQWVSMSPVFQNVKNSGGKKRFANLELPETKRTYIGHDVWIGHGVSIKQGVKIGTGAVIGTGSVVTKDVSPYAVVAGCPAKFVKYRFTKELIDKLLESEWWNLSDECLMQNGKYINNPELFLGAIKRSK